MITNREQHELAAKAAGLFITWKEGHCKGGPFAAAFIGDQSWRPKENDGDAFRLQVALGMLVVCNEQILIDYDLQAPGTEVYAGAVGEEKIIAREPHGDDKLAATRLAIFRAAIEIGKAMP